MEKSESSEAPWLLLIHQLPSEPSRVRVRTWRRLQGAGAVAVKNSVYVLPSSSAARENFESIRAEIVAQGGDAVVFCAAGADGVSESTVRGEVERARQRDWQELGERCRAILEAHRTHEPTGGDMMSELQRQARSLRARAARIDEIDPFRVSGRAEALAELERIDELLRPVADAARSGSAPRSRADYQDRIWQTRPGPGVDRMASAWLIRRFIDPRARFRFGDEMPAQDEAVPFDMRAGEFARRGERATFETLMHEFGLREPALKRLAGIVRDIEPGSEARIGPESATVAQLVRGLRRSFGDDATLLDHGMAVFEALYASYTSSGLSN